MGFRRATAVIEISDADYSGSDGAAQTVRISDVKADRYRLRVDAGRLVSGGPVPVSLTAIEAPEREATLVVSPTRVRHVGTGNGEGTTKIEVGEGGKQRPIDDIVVSTGALSTTDGDTIPATAVSASPAEFSLEPGGHQTVRLSMDVAGGAIPSQGETRFEGTATIQTANAGSVDVTLSTLALDADDSSVTLSSAAASVTGVYLTTVSPLTLSNVPADVTVQAAYVLRTDGDGEFGLRFSDVPDSGTVTVYAVADGEWTTVDHRRFTESVRATVQAGPDRTIVLAWTPGGDDGGPPGDWEEFNDLPDWAPWAGASGALGLGTAGYRYLKDSDDGAETGGDSVR